MPVIGGAPAPTDPADWEPNDPNDPNFGLTCVTDECSETCTVGIVKYVGFDFGNPGFYTILRGCDCPGEGGNPHSDPPVSGNDPVGGDGQSLCTLAAKVNRHVVTGQEVFIEYVCAGVCPGNEHCQIVTTLEQRESGTLLYADIMCDCQ
jgi:hypothetical protein